MTDKCQLIEKKITFLVDKNLFQLKKFLVDLLWQHVQLARQALSLGHMTVCLVLLKGICAPLGTLCTTFGI